MLLLEALLWLVPVSPRGPLVLAALRYAEDTADLTQGHVGANGPAMYAEPGGAPAPAAPEMRSVVAIGNAAAVHEKRKEMTVKDRRIRVVAFVANKPTVLRTLHEAAVVDARWAL